MKKFFETLLGYVGALFLLSLVIGIIFSFGFQDFYAPFAPIVSSIIKYSFFTTLILMVIVGLQASQKKEKVTSAHLNANEKKVKTAQVTATEKNKAGLFHSGIFCPYCRSLDIQFMQNDKKGFSISKSVGGTVLAGGIGSLAGFAGKKGKKNEWRCNDCGRTFKK